jgi:chemotaxis protein MotB
MRNRRRLLMPEESSENFWPSFTDLTSTIALILFVLVLLAYLQNLISGQHLERLRAEQHATSLKLEASREKIRSAEERLNALSAAIRTGQAQLALSEAKVQEQQDVIASSNQELETLKAQLQGMAFLRMEVLDKVKASLESQLEAAPGDTSPSVGLAENGNIVINESLVFESNSHTIKAAGKPLLDTLSQAFSRVLADRDVSENIDVILVQGHTDERGTVPYNRDLSAKRANAVLNYMFEANPALETAYGSYFASSAYSEFRPVTDSKSEAAYEKNRRIEISVVLKDTRMRTLIDEYMRGLDPMLQPVP